MKILLFGSRGQVGSALRHALPSLHELIISDIDITDVMRLRDIININRPDIIINAAAYTNVEGAEEESARAFAINAEAPSVMAEAAKEIGALLIHYSTDYVFNGQGHVAWVETDSPAPLNIYGQSKLKGDENIIQSGCRHLIFRTSWVYAKDHSNFPTNILALAKEQQNLNVVSDQIGAPTPASFIAAATYHAIAQNNKTGLYQLCCAGETSWAEFAKLVIGTLNPHSSCTITPILSADYPQKAKRPLNSRLSTAKFSADFNYPISQWDEAFHAEFQ